MYCSNCGKEIPDNAVFCPGCGHKTQDDMRMSDRGNQPGGSRVVKIVLIAAAAVVILGAGIFGITRMQAKSASKQEEPAAQTFAEAGEDAAGTRPNTMDAGTMDGENAYTYEKDSANVLPQETDRPGSGTDGTDPGAQGGKNDTEGFSSGENGPVNTDVYDEVIGKADTYDYGIYETENPTGKYRYAFVTLQEGDSLPALLLAQETDSYMEYVRVFLYDPDTKTMRQPAESILTGAAGAGGFRGGLSTGEDSVGLQLTEFMSGTGEADAYQIKVEGDTLIRELIWSGMIDSMPDSLPDESPGWVEIDKGTDDTENTDEDRDGGDSDTDGNAADLPEDGDRTVLTGTIDTYSYDEVVELQGKPDPNAEWADRSVTYRIIVLDKPQVLRGIRDDRMIEEEVSLILVDVDYHLDTYQYDGADIPAEYDGKHITFSVSEDTLEWPSGTDLPLGEPHTNDVHILE